MKTLSLLTLIIIAPILFYGCSKSSSAPAANNNTNNNNNNGNTNVTRDTLLGSVSAYIDDTLVQFDADATAQADFLSNGNTISITGIHSTSPYSEITFTLSTAGPIDSGTYSASSTPVGYLSFIYVAPQYGTGTLGSYTTPFTNSASITINSIVDAADTIARGSFTGGVVTDSSANPISHTITNGKFNVPVTF